MRIGCVADVRMGYGSPQIPALVSSLAQYYGAETLVVEPSFPDRPNASRRPPQIYIEPAGNLLAPYTVPGRIDYILRAAERMNRYDPDILVLTCTYCLPVVFRLRKRPRFVIYQSLESIPAYGDFDVQMNRQLRDRVDLVIFPEENRAIFELERCGLRGIPLAILYNCPTLETTPQRSAHSNGRILSCGTIDRERTLAEYYLRPELQHLPIDLFGSIEGDHDGFVAGLKGNIRYCGRVDSVRLGKLRRDYAYSVVIWNPDNENQYYAAPNKFFESIASGIPPIAAPHPQCKQILQRYNCGLLMPDWSFDGFRTTLESAAKMAGSPEWEEMSANCLRAAIQELNWDRQFEKLKSHLNRVN